MLRFAPRSLVSAAAIASISGTLALAACTAQTKPATLTTGAGGPSQAGGGGGDSDAGPASSCAFAASPTSFALPSILEGPSQPFPLIADQLSCGSGPNFDYSLTDMNADGQPDLLVTAACADATVGVSAWLVYLNDGTSFATTPIRYALPPAAPTAGCASSWLADINGDDLLDSIVTSLCDDATVGTSRWLVYLGSKTGFAQTATPYALPPGYSSGTFKTTSGQSVCTATTNSPSFYLFDLNGDGVDDIVVTATCSDPTVGTTAWLLYAGGASGVAQTATRFTLPTSPTVTSGAFATPTGALSCTTSVTRPTYDLVDFNLDGKLDLVETQECPSANDTTVGTSTWLWYENGGQGFSIAQTIALPSLVGVPTGSYTSLSGTGTCANNAGAPTYTLLEFTGDPTLDLLVTRNCSDTLSGTSYWEVFPGGASGFSASPRKLTLPAALTAVVSPMGLTGVEACTAPLLPGFATTSLIGGQLDIVETGLCNDTSVGSSRWLVYPLACH